MSTFKLHIKRESQRIFPLFLQVPEENVFFFLFGKLITDVHMPILNLHTLARIISNVLTFLRI
jgi:hypothetical protein